MGRHLMERVEAEALKVSCPLIADELVRRQPLEGLEPQAEVVGESEMVNVISQLA